jgi:hypothetical protein
MSLPAKLPAVGSKLALGAQSKGGAALALLGRALGEAVDALVGLGLFRLFFSYFIFSRGTSDLLTPVVKAGIMAPVELNRLMAGNPLWRDYLGDTLIAAKYRAFKQALRALPPDQKAVNALHDVKLSSS